MGNLVLTGATSGSTTVQPTDAVTAVITLPATSGTLALAAGGGSPTFTSITTTNDASISGRTVGKGGGSIATNTAVGDSALSSNTSGLQNNSFGTSALTSNTTGSYNCGFGRASLLFNTTGSYNTALGGDALFNNTTDRKSTRLNSSHRSLSRMPSSA